MNFKSRWAIAVFMVMISVVVFVVALAPGRRGPAGRPAPTAVPTPSPRVTVLRVPTPVPGPTVFLTPPPIVIQITQAPAPSQPHPSSIPTTAKPSRRPTPAPSPSPTCLPLPKPVPKPCR